MANLTEMNAATCTAIATVIPVFLVALIAERTTRGKAPTRRTAIDLLKMFLVAVADLLLATLMIVVELTALFGINSDGLRRDDALGTWVLTIIVIFVLLYRWALRNPAIAEPTSAAIDWSFDKLFVATTRLTAATVRRLNAIAARPVRGEEK